MSALPPKADIGTHSRDVRFVPKADICDAANCTLFDHLIGTSLQRLWHGPTEGFGGLDSVARSVAQISRLSLTEYPRRIIQHGLAVVRSPQTLFQSIQQKRLSCDLPGKVR